jgi:hypothetical protein
MGLNGALVGTSPLDVGWDEGNAANQVKDYYF